MTFNPFNKGIHETLDESDLQLLISNTVTEGYYVEYKIDFPSNIKIARSVASFANSYGGWYIVGVETDAHNVATRIAGIDLHTSPDPTDKIREVVKSRIDPIPLFHTQIVPLSTGRVVPVVFIPDHQATPFITSDGRIYRRQADSSTPVFETDRYAIDQLVRSGKTVAEEFGAFCKDDRVFSEAESDNPWIEVYISPHPPNLIEKFSVPSAATLEDLLDRSREQVHLMIPGEDDSSEVQAYASGNVEFHAGHINYDSVTIVRLPTENQWDNSHTVELFRNGSAKIFIPISCRRPLPHEVPEMTLSLRTRENLMSYVDGFSGLLKLMDFGELAIVIGILTNYYTEWLGRENPIVSLQTIVRASNTWRCAAYHDSDPWNDHVENYGLPVLRKQDYQSPPNLSEPSEVSLTNSWTLWLKLLVLTGFALGLPSDLSIRILFQQMHAEGRREGDT